MLKHMLGRSNMIVDALSRRPLLLSTIIMEIVGLEEMKRLYEEDLDFVEAWKASKEP